MRFLPYNPEQDYLLPPSVHGVLGPQHLCFFLHRVVERLDLNAFKQDYQEKGRPAAPVTQAPSRKVTASGPSEPPGIVECKLLAFRS